MAVSKDPAVAMTELEALLRLPQTRPEARAAGSLLYFPALRCLKGHTAARSVSGGRCVACVQAARRGKVDAAKAEAAQTRAKRDAPKVAALLAAQAVKEKARDEKKAALRAAREARAKQRIKEKAAATRAANKAAKAAEAQAALAVVAVELGATEGPQADDRTAPWD